jgi:hypothetical protein
MKAEVEKILEELLRDMFLPESGTNPIDDYKEDINRATSSLTALIIKWLEGKKRETHTNAVGSHSWSRDCGRNQLITELIGEVR